MPPPDRTPASGTGRARGGVRAAQSDRTAIAGERFSAADVCVGSHGGWGLAMGTIEKRPAFADDRSRIENRDARQRAEAIDNAPRGDTEE